MDWSFKQVAGVLIAVVCFSVAFLGLQENLKKQGENANAHTKVAYINSEDIVNDGGVVADKSKKPKVIQDIFHMRKGNYEKFDYQTLIFAEKYDGTAIEKDCVFDYHEKIDGSKVGVNILYYTVYDNQSNFVQYKVAVIVEGTEDINTAITNYEEGKLL